MSLNLASQEPTTEDAGGPIVGEVPGYLRYWVLLAAVAALLLVYPFWLVRNLLSDQFGFWAAERQGTEQAYRRYRNDGRLYAAEAKDKLGGAALADARNKGTVSALQAVRRKYQGTAAEDEASVLIRRVYQESSTRYLEQAPADPEVRSFMETLFRFLERGGLSSIEVGFIRPNSSELSTYDRRLRSQASTLGRRAAELGHHFTGAGAVGREQLLVNRLNETLADILPSEVLTLSLGPPYPSLADSPTDRARLVVDYRVRPSGELHESQKITNPRTLFVGLRFDFRVTMQHPEQTESIDFALAVPPPSGFRYECFDRSLNYGPVDGWVYAAMGEAAFHQLADKLRSSFFTNGSQSLRRTAAPPQ